MTTNKIHPTAIIHESAKIAADVEIGAYAIIGEDTVIEEGCKSEKAQIFNLHILVKIQEFHHLPQSVESLKI